MGNPPPIPKPVIQIAQAIALAGGRTWIVGGWVRDYLLGRSSKDVDIEVSGLSFTQLHDVLSNIGPVRAVGRSFPIFKFHHSDYEIDLALPRKHSHPDGTVEVDPNLSLKEFRKNSSTITTQFTHPIFIFLYNPNAIVSQ